MALDGDETMAFEPSEKSKILELGLLDWMCRRLSCRWSHRYVGVVSNFNSAKTRINTGESGDFKFVGASTKRRRAEFCGRI